MININNFTINAEANILSVSVTTDIDDTITSAIVWTEKTYKDYSLAIDVSNLLVGTSNVETFDINASTLGVSALEGIYFIEFQSTSESESSCDECNNSLGVAASLLSFSQCILDKVLKYSICKESSCNDILKQSIINIQSLKSSFMIALEFGYHEEAIIIYNTLQDKFCGKCSGCNNLIDPTFRTGLDYGTLDDTLILI